MRSVDVPGRGAWTCTGGLLRIIPNARSTAGYYRAPAAGEQMIGSRMNTFTHFVVREGVRAIQKLVLPYATGIRLDGVFGEQTGTAVAAAQHSLGLKRDGVFGPATARTLLAPIIEETATRHGVPVDVLGGICVHESHLDPAAIGVSGYDVGICQINTSASAVERVPLRDMVDPWRSLDWTARGMAYFADWWREKTAVPLADLMAAQHNSPKSAVEWARTGVPPWSPERASKGFPQIDAYVASVRTAWETNA